MTENDKSLEQGNSTERDRAKLEGAYKAVIDIYGKVVALGNDASERVPGNPSVKTDLLHQVAHSLLRIQAFSDGGFPSYELNKINPNMYDEIRILSAEDLLRIYEGNTKIILGKFSEPGVGQKTFRQPYGPDISGADFLRDIARHEEYHLGKLSVVEACLNLGRSKPLDAHWGPPLK